MTFKEPEDIMQEQIVPTENDTIGISFIDKAFGPFIFGEEYEDHIVTKEMIDKLRKKLPELDDVTREKLKSLIYLLNTNLGMCILQHGATPGGEEYFVVGE